MIKLKIDNLQLIIVTGLSGAGKTQAIRCLEDINFFCVDNLPPSLVPNFLKEIENVKNIHKVALGIDIRGGIFFEGLEKALASLDELGIKYSVLFLDASNEILIRRFKETRRGHPLSDVDIIDAIIEERKIMSSLKDKADIFLDTSDMSSRQLKAQITNIFGGEKKELPVTVVSFGFKYGIPMDADLVVDVRFIPNPYYDLELRPLSGYDIPVRDYVLDNKITQDFLQKYADLLQYLIPHYRREGKSQLVIAIGCTGGRHRSVAIVNHLALRINEFDCKAITKHRDISRETGGV